MKESKTIEFKEKVSATFLKTVSAFSKFSGGKIIFGIDDGGTLKGLSNLTDTALKIEHMVHDTIHPTPDFTLEIDWDKETITLLVHEGRDKPYLYKGMAYIRSHTSTIEVSNLELKRLTLQGLRKTFDELPAKNQKLTFSELEKRLRKELGIEKVTKDILRTLGLYHDEEGYTRAGELLSDDHDYHGLDIARFGDSINIIRERVTLEKESILLQQDKALEFFRKHYQYEEIEGAYRVKKELIPEEAFREALANALIHREWDVSAFIRIAMDDEKIEVYSPGGLPPGVTEEDYLEGYLSTFRNPILATLFYRLHLIEMFGTGIRRIKEAYKNWPNEPTFIITDNAVKIVLPTNLKKERLYKTQDEMLLLDTIHEGRLVTRDELSKHSGFSKDKTIRVINSLIEKGYMVKEGGGRSTKYYKSREKKL